MSTFEKHPVFSRNSRLVAFAALWVLVFISIGNYYRHPVVSPEPAYEILEKEIDGNSMEPLLANGSKILLLVGYYRWENLPERGDIVAYDYGGNQHPLIKMVRGLPSDAAEIDLIRKTLKINGEYLTNSAGTPYVFTNGELQLLGLYVKGGHLPSGGYFIFGDNVGNSVDSRKFWAVSKNDFYGKFIPKP